MLVGIETLEVKLIRSYRHSAEQYGSCLGPRGKQLRFFLRRAKLCKQVKVKKLVSCSARLLCPSHLPVMLVLDVPGHPQCMFDDEADHARSFELLLPLSLDM